MPKTLNKPQATVISDRQIKSELQALKQSEKLIDLSGDTSPVELWKALFPKISPKKMQQTLQNGVGRNATVTLELRRINKDEENNLECSVCIDPKDSVLPSGYHAAKITFATTDDGLHHEDICLKNASVSYSQQQGKHLLAGSLSRIVGMLKEQGTQNVTMTAVKVGAYSWVKYGFRPNNKREWEYLKEDMAKRIEEGHPPHIRLAASKNERYPITAATKQAIENVLKSDDPADIIHLTELTEVLGQKHGHDITVGKALLMDSYWKGKLPLNEYDLGYQQFVAYTDEAKGRGVQK